jgi:hypothetical protein
VPGVERPKVDAGPERHEESSALVDMIVGRINAVASALLGRPASESGRLRHGDGDHEGAAALAVFRSAGAKKSVWPPGIGEILCPGAAATSSVRSGRIDPARAVPGRHGGSTMRQSLIAALMLALLVSIVPGSLGAVEVGQKAPDFTLNNPDGKPVKLADLTAKGSVVIYTFVAAFTPT